MAATDTKRREVYAFLRADANVRLLLSAAEDGGVAISAVSNNLLNKFGLKFMTSNAMRQFAGLTVAGILEENGFVIGAKGVRIRDDALFSVGSRFERVKTRPGLDGQSLLERFVSVLTQEELDILDEALVAARRRHAATNC